jgi:DNA-binding NarL/FixJ family response regulator
MGLLPLSGPADLLRLHRRFPDTRIVVLANPPTAADCTQMLEFGATGCLSKETQAKDIITAIHLASRGMHVLPRSASVGGGVNRLPQAGRAVASGARAHGAGGRGGRGRRAPAGPDLS